MITRAVKSLFHQPSIVSREKGFTLLEILIALFVTAIVGVISTNGINNALIAQEVTSAQSKQLNDLAVFYGILSRDLRQVIPRSVLDSYGDDPEPAFFAPEGGEVAMQFSRTGWHNPRPELLQRSTLQRVAYLLEGDELIRESWDALDRTDETESHRVVLLDNVSRLKIEYLNPEKSQLGQTTVGNAISKKTVGGKWEEDWPHPTVELGSRPDNPGYTALPIAVDVVIEFGEWGEIRRLIELPDVSVQ
jgi:general secretion pathway protein J